VIAFRPHWKHSVIKGKITERTVQKLNTQRTFPNLLMKESGWTFITWYCIRPTFGLPYAHVCVCDCTADRLRDEKNATCTACQERSAQGDLLSLQPCTNKMQVIISWRLMLLVDGTEECLLLRGFIIHAPPSTQDTWDTNSGLLECYTVAEFVFPDVPTERTAFILPLNSWKTQALCSFEKPGNINQVTRRHIPHDLNPQQNRRRNSNLACKTFLRRYA
jgi:hypothetical protein